MKNTAIMLSLALMLALTAALTARGGGNGKTPSAEAGLEVHRKMKALNNKQQPTKKRTDIP